MSTQPKMRATATIRFKVLVSLLSLVVLLFGVGGFGFYASSEMIRSFKTVYEDRVVPMRKLKDVSDNYNIVVASVLGMIVNGEIDEKESHKMLTEAVEEARENWESYLSSDLTPEEKELAAKHGPLVEDLDSFSDTIIQTLGKGDMSGAKDLIRKNTKLHNKFIEMHEVFDDFVSVQENISRQEFNNSMHNYDMIVVVFSVVAVLSLLAVGGALAVTRQGIIRPLTGMADAMSLIASQKFQTTVPNLGEPNELGMLASALDVFKKNGIERQRMQEEQALAAKKHEERTHRLEKEIRDFEGTVSAIVNAVAAAATELRANSETLAHVADSTSAKATSVAAAAEQASANVQTVAASAEEMSASIGEISQRVGDASKRADGAAMQAQSTSGTIQTLTEAAQKIGSVVELVQEIASQTNLLALNATIEAARAGEAGKGFAVVASEVKNLANQTAKATEEISAQIGSIQGVTGEAREAIEGISASILDINQIMSSIAAATEQQRNATVEISRSVGEAAQGTQEVSSHVVTITTTSGETGRMAGDALGAAADLSKQAEALKREVDNFISRVRAI